MNLGCSGVLAEIQSSCCVTWVWSISFKSNSSLKISYWSASLTLHGKESTLKEICLSSLFFEAVGVEPSLILGTDGKVLNEGMCWHAPE